MSQIVKLKCSVQNYLWGKPAPSSLVAEFTNNAEDSDRYAELWMGTHKKGHSVVLSSGQMLSEWIEEDLENRLGSLCQTISGKQDGNLPFLLKILSVDKALSIQVHPTKEHADELHASKPQHYPDPNHKPEMAIALTEFEGLCGFKPFSEILENMRNHNELHEYLTNKLVDIISGNKSVDDETGFIKKLFSELIELPNVAEIIQNKLNSNSTQTASDELFLRIDKQHPGDTGLVCIYLLNHVVLQPGECMFLGANKIHAYFSGDCVECMACSDNVVRAGLTGKFKDVSTLLSMVDCTPGTVESQKLRPILTKGDHIRRYLPPVKDFAVDRVMCNPKCVTLPCKTSPQIIICTEGSGDLKTEVSHVTMTRGEVAYVVPNVSVTFTGELVLFAAYSQE